MPSLIPYHERSTVHIFRMAVVTQQLTRSWIGERKGESLRRLTIAVFIFAALIALTTLMTAQTSSSSSLPKPAARQSPNVATDLYFVNVIKQ